LEQARTRVGCVTAGAERVPTGDGLEHDPAPALAVPLPQEPDRSLDALRMILGGIAELVDRERRGGDDKKSLDRPGETVDRIGGDQAERAFHSEILSLSARETLIGLNGAAWLRSISPALWSSSSARRATACSMRGSPSTSVSKSKTRRRERSARKRSRNC